MKNKKKSSSKDASHSKRLSLFSIYDVVNMDKELIKDKIFIVYHTDKHKSNSRAKYVQIKKTNYIKDTDVDPSS